MPLKRNFARYAPTSGSDVYLYRRLEEFLDSEPFTGISSISYGAGTLDLQLISRESQNLVTVFHAAADPAKTTLPVFVGHKITQDLDASILLVSDPSLDFAIPIGWFAGDHERRLQHDLAQAIQHVAVAVGARNLIFQGSSAGGFAALYYAHGFPGSLAVAVNPQTNIAAYHADKVAQYFNSCWNGTPPLPAQAVTDLLQLYDGSFSNCVLFLQNQQDQFHIENHYRPWAARFKDLYAEKWCTLQGDWGKGHAAPPPELQELVLKFALSFEGDWGSLMKEEDFEDGLALP